MGEVKVMIFNCNCFLTFSFTVEKARIPHLHILQVAWNTCKPETLLILAAS